MDEVCVFDIYITTVSGIRVIQIYERYMQESKNLQVEGKVIRGREEGIERQHSSHHIFKKTQENRWTDGSGDRETKS